MPFLLGQCRSTDDDCPCCDHNYDAGRTDVTIEFVEKVALPHGWSLTEALANPLDQDWHETHVLGTLEEMRRLGESERLNYPLRQAALAEAFLDHAPWALHTRFGVAWASIRVGMRYHGWRPNYSQASIQFLDPAPDLFEQYSGTLALSDLLTRGFTHVDADPSSD